MQLNKSREIPDLPKQPCMYCIKWDHFEILTSLKNDYHCKIKGILFI